MPNTYRHHKYKNPYYRAKKQQKTSRFYYSLMTLGIIIFSWVYFLFFSSFFKIADIEIYGLNKYKKSDINTSINNFFKLKKNTFFKFSNIFIFNTGDLQKYFSSQLLFKTITIKKHYPHKIILTVEEKQEKLAICSGNKIFVLADDITIVSIQQGIEDWVLKEKIITTSTSVGDPTPIKINKILSDIKTKSLPNYPIFCDAYHKTKSLKIGDTYPNKDTLKILTTFVDNLNDQAGIKTKIVTLHKNKTSPKITVHTTNNWKIYLNNKEDGLKQFYKLFLVFNNKIKEGDFIK